MSDSIKLTEEEKRNLPNREWAKWATKVTGKPEMEFWLQGVFYLTEVKGFEHDEAEKIMAENW
jgi:hypothetical protein